MITYMEPKRFRKFGDQLTEYCRRHNITKLELARHMKVTSAYISHVIARGGTKGAIEDICRAATELAHDRKDPLSPWDIDRYHLVTMFDRIVEDRDEWATFCAWLMMEGQRRDPKDRKRLMEKSAA